MTKKYLLFFDEKELLFEFLKRYSHHKNHCNETKDLLSSAYDFFLNFMIVTNSRNSDIIFHFIAFPLLKNICYKSDTNYPENFIGEGGIGDVKMAIRSFYSMLSNKNDDTTSLIYVIKYFSVLSSRLINLNTTHLEEVERLFLKICKFILDSDNTHKICLVIETLPHILTLFKNTENVISTLIKPLFSIKKNIEIRDKSTDILQKLICCLNSDYIKILQWKGMDLDLNIFCEKCLFGNIKDAKDKDDYLKLRFSDDALGINFRKIDVDLTINCFFLKYIFALLSTGVASSKIICLKTLPFVSNHVIQFHSANVTKMWMEMAGDPDKDVRKEFGNVVGSTIKYGQENTALSEETKLEIIGVICTKMLALTKKSLQFSDFELQNTLLQAIDSIILIKSDKLIIEMLKVLIYLIMVPTSKYSMVAVNKCYRIAKLNDTTMMMIYSQNKKALTEVIVHLCAVNQALINQSLSKSLEKISLMFGFYGSKDFASQKSNNILPHLVAKSTEMPAVSKLIEEMANFMEMELSEMLSCKYGYIFIHLFLNTPTDQFKKSMTYLEKATGLTGPTLRKRNFRIILNELLLKFHEKKDKVITALKLLADEDVDTKTNSVSDYLQSHFLGVLLYFDVHLISKNPKKEPILLSLANLLRYMGPKHITPLRFKIIAMLQTTNYGQFPNLSCEVWNAFLRSCDIDSLGPQLATIFVSVLPLVEHCPVETNNIFRYLIVDNEATMKSFVADLFFVSNQKVDIEVTNIIKKNLQALERCTLKEKIRKFLKYLTHEATEVRIRGLRKLKGYMETSRKELDQMILDYNGIDPAIVELIDILTLGCREKDEELKLACGEVFGELGAIEPSHLPRKYSNEDKTFSFFINEDAFIIDTLSELIRALQAEKNTQNMDKYALAIQEILKEYDISPENKSSKKYLWEQFPDSQREVMLPLLSSHYMLAQPVSGNNFPTPIYGSNEGASFYSWLCNWASSLILSLPNEKKVLLNVFLPSMKQDKRILMHFLPYILLHSLIEGNGDIDEKSYVELQSIISSFTRNKVLDKKVLNLRPLVIPGTISKPKIITPEAVKQLQCTKVVFLLLDFLDRWIREWQWQKNLIGQADENFKKINQFKNRMCKLQLAKCNYHCGEYPRALLYLETYITENREEIGNHLLFLSEIYAQLEEPDGVAGVTALRQIEPSVQERILDLEVSGKLADATTCYERMSQPLKLRHIQGLVQCYLDLDNVNSALNFVKGAADNQPEYENMLLEMQAEPLWRLGRYDDLNNLLTSPDLMDNKSWGIQIGKALLSIKKRDREQFSNTLNVLKKSQVELFGAASLEEGAYQHSYSCVTKLHALNELQHVEKMLFDLLLKPNDGTFAENLVKKLAEEWKLRIKVVEESVRVVEPLLCLRRVSLSLARNICENSVPLAVPPLDWLLGECWLLSAKIARSAGMHQQAYTYTIKAENYSPPTLFLEKAKLHWLREEHEQALITLKRSLEVVIPEGTGTPQLTALDLDLETKKIYSEAKLLIATYNDAISNVDVEVNLQYYKQVCEIYREWEESLVCLAQHCDKMFQNLDEKEHDGHRGCYMLLSIINYYGKSLQYGTKYVYQSMPRLLSIWFDYGTKLLDVTDSSVREERKTTLLKMTKLIDSFHERLPAYVFLTAFSQLVSRICHAQKEVYLLLKSIILMLLQNYPQQSLWMIISVIKSSYPVRSKRCAEILCDPRLKSATMSKLVKDFTTLAEKLIELCNKEIPTGVQSTSVVSLGLKVLPRMLGKEDFSEIMMPTYKFRKLILPNPDFKNSQHNPFPNHYVHIVGIENEITILQSLQRPRKITLRGSDGKGYIYMLKPKDDLRKDFRLMEFNDIVNQLLARDSDSRQRRLNIRLYSVVPLNEECGLIEWIPNLIGLRPVLISIYKQRAILLSATELRNMCCHIRDPLEKKRDIFTKKLVPRHPAVLGEWFRKTFPDAQSWFTARTAYIRTTAVMSMAGYILGLGDRHGENILLDSTCGDVVHVDFNCLFNKGESFDWPERVPFRLTHNMVAAMGPLGYEGVFRKSCACTLRVLRMHVNTLIAIVTPFVYDPLVSWPRNIPNAPSTHNAERTNEQAVEHVKNIKLRLQGRVKSRSRAMLTPLSVDGQTNYLINEAVNVDNLCQMFCGWGAYL